jgi:hypothetical protein
MISSAQDESSTICFRSHLLRAALAAVGSKRRLAQAQANNSEPTARKQKGQREAGLFLD